MSSMIIKIQRVLISTQLISTKIRTEKLKTDGKNTKQIVRW